MTETMKAAVVTQFQAPLEIQDLPIPTPGPGEVLIKTLYSGVCHTDLHAAHGDWPVKPTPPFIPGHEGAGEVVAVGEGVTELQVGDWAGNAWLWSACGHCEWCQTGRETLCPNAQYGGYTKDGSFGQYMVVDAKFAPRIPKTVDLAAVAPILCAGVTVYKGLKESEVKPGEWVLISGVGGLGHIAVQYAVAMGMRVATVDVDDAKSELARKHGAELTFNAITEGDNLDAKIKEATGGGVHGGLVTAVNGKAFPLAVGALRSGGTVSLVGLPPEAFPLDIFSTVLFGLTIRGSLVGTRKDMEEAIDFFARGLIKPTYKVQPLAEVNEIFDDMIAAKIDGRIVMDMGH
ncbi:alcohol dehydrogenase AdhP [Xylanimonas allomyrinae]|uniref:Alcohol dehydrogenase n=1 Tax=Xylanimonas allomyrinae TaxID=2509459 RepID=A0A4P6EMX7_9MICO|nr:alcohol dehydrogenase AdhP [Xylanimonas allomyrinae]QAY63805.1 alcohol dehydrogenase AdhP [Xylanimonas allomyrinae]